MTSHTTQIPTSEETPPPIPRQETEDGYIMRLAIMDDINEEREKMKKEDFWQKSRAEGDRRREVRIRELRAQSSRQS
ncbi:hypothetical protein N7452_005007 [Penicillium brevicompactum]|uniref:Uncharacterized protein n=1 Tax=Penicillium brevicompactum TaxID=5074 RepID=A0A9W9QKM4_PENBR|nr:hypothetical protein N7452_005007 [Penicillium brevicompactum]